ncbi:hypothetical protein DB30_02126 [Enhygromyxa salina]|uniref:Uncharacterized protein n=1 Tax=Enhygromyxa salina TaxID=215803 RepID=A0A0C1ZM64_9BACT|nr:hypothetical protein DB30_02126 [Enhygromyxa salina]
MKPPTTQAGRDCGHGQRAAFWHNRGHELPRSFKSVLDLC